jgi:hypothetical protein
LTEEHITYISLCRFQGTCEAMLRQRKEPRLTISAVFQN